MISAFKTLQFKSVSPTQRVLAATAVEHLQHGHYIWPLFQPFVPLLGSGILTLLRLSETGGYFAEGVENIRNLLELQSKMHRKLKQAFIYPICLLGIAVLFLLVVSCFLLPQLKLFLSEQSEEATFARLVFRLNDRAPMLLLAVLAVAVPIIGVLKFKKRLSIASIFNFVGRGWLAYGHFTGNLGMLLKQRLPLLQALKLTFSDVPLKRLSFEAVRDGLRKGQTLAQAANGLPKELRQAIETAETRGNLAPVLQQWSRYCYQRYEECWMRVLKWTEPLCIAGIVLLVLAAAAFAAQPLMQVLRSMDWDVLQ